MYFRDNHELHKRRLGRNMGLGLVLAGFVALVFGLTVVKVTQTNFDDAPGKSGAGVQGTAVEGAEVQGTALQSAVSDTAQPAGETEEQQ